jgi:hypothetical protein
MHPVHFPARQQQAQQCVQGTYCGGWRRCACLDAKTRVLAVGALASTTCNNFIADLLFLSEVSHPLPLLVAGAPCVHHAHPYPLFGEIGPEGPGGQGGLQAPGTGTPHPAGARWWLSPAAAARSIYYLATPATCLLLALLNPAPSYSATCCQARIIKNAQDAPCANANLHRSALCLWKRNKTMTKAPDSNSDALSRRAWGA